MKLKTAPWPTAWIDRAAWPKVPDDVGDLRWQAAAECRDADDRTSWRLVEATRADEVADLVASLCSACTVAVQCLQTGQGMHADGVWGGVLLVDGRERRAATA